MSPHSLIPPNIHIYPPVEDSVLPWCFFEAAEHQLDSDTVDKLVRSSQSQSPPFHRNSKRSVDSMMSRKSLEREMPVDEDSGYGDYGDITIRGNEPGDCSEVIEVIKVKRTEKHSERDSHSSRTPVPQPMKRSQTFISRAFKSIKNVNRTIGSRTKKPPHVQDVFSSSESTDYAETTNTTPRPSRRGSSSLISLFSTPQQSEPRSSVDSTSPSVSRPRRLRQLDSVSRRSSSSSLDAESPFSQPRPRYEDEDDDLDVDSIDIRLSLRSQSPTPSTQTFSAKKRFSVLNLFSRNMSSTTISSPGSENLVPSPPRCSSRCSSSSSSAGPVTPVEPVATFIAAPFDAPIIINDDAPPKGLRRLSSFRRGGKGNKNKSPGKEVQVHNDPSTEDPDGHRGDISFEMRLDSFHFDDLTFDVERF
ncbi:hypothetical protein C8J56DRAFT_1057005 [Mycena floridula]|nr:hypothetical protein C8J56DRAFT_1057005 [Mycena floridula]